VGLSPRTTNPSRGLLPSNLAIISETDRRKMALLLLYEADAEVVAFDPRAGFDILTVKNRPLWADRIGQVRIFYRPIEQNDIEQADNDLRALAHSDVVLIETTPRASEVTPIDTVQLITAEDFILRLEESSLITWSADRQPTADTGRYVDWRVVQSATISDRVGLRYLISLSFNKPPPGLISASSPDALFERFAFRVWTTVFRFSGWRLGEVRRGKRAADAILLSPRSAPRFSALFDAKAARDGYTMSVGDERALVEYAQGMKDDPELDGFPLRFIIVVSSSFPGARTPHPFEARSTAIKDACGLNLVYIEARDLVFLAMELEEREIPPVTRDRCDWTQAFVTGRVDLEDLRRAAGLS
jgi:hypothetical protein